MSCNSGIVSKKIGWLQNIRKSSPSVGITSQKNRNLSYITAKI
jgi:hypothetical protein